MLCAGGELLLHPFTAPLSAAGLRSTKHRHPCFPGGEKWMEEGSHVGQQVPESWELNPGCPYLLTPSPTAIFSSHCTLVSGIAGRLER